MIIFRCWVSGWGRNDFVSGTYQTIQKQVDVPVQANTFCQSSLAATRLGPSFIFDPASFICAGGEPGKDACTVIFKKIAFFEIIYELFFFTISRETVVRHLFVYWEADISWPVWLHGVLAVVLEMYLVFM